MVSIIFPVYNVAPYLDLSIQSILDQDFGDIEIIAVNDGSTDKSLDILKKYTNDERIKIINQSNQGAAKARLTGLEYASGDYVAFV
ncbi:glycosyltransferase, partial [Lacrimispora saccharolytica]|nr:glycosyltransferase [Lacrimispora saccharolytica]